MKVKEMSLLTYLERHRAICAVGLWCCVATPSSEEQLNNFRKSNCNLFWSYLFIYLPYLTIYFLYFCLYMYLFFDDIDGFFLGKRRRQLLNLRGIKIVSQLSYIIVLVAMFTDCVCGWLLCTPCLLLILLSLRLYLFSAFDCWWYFVHAYVIQSHISLLVAKFYLLSAFVKPDCDTEKCNLYSHVNQ